MKEINIVNRYFAGFAAKNIQQISENFSDDIVLIDWVGEWCGAENVKNAISGFLESDIVIVLEKVSLNYEDGIIVINCMIDIHVGNECIKAFDVIEILDGKIKSVTAYKR
jgi:hypothetical protein